MTTTTSTNKCSNNCKNNSKNINHNNYTTTTAAARTAVITTTTIVTTFSAITTAAAATFVLNQLKLLCQNMISITKSRVVTTTTATAAATTTAQTMKVPAIATTMLAIMRIAMLLNLLQLAALPTRAQIMRATTKTTTIMTTTTIMPAITTTELLLVATDSNNAAYANNMATESIWYQLPTLRLALSAQNNNNYNKQYNNNNYNNKKLNKKQHNIGNSTNNMNAANTYSNNNNNNSALALTNDSASAMPNANQELELEQEMSYHPYCIAQRNSFVDLFTVVLYAIVCLVGLFGNTLVIYVVLRFSKMQTVTNIYILNLAIADECFLIGIPFLLYTMRICSWKFGEYMCKAYMVSTSITQFTSSIFLLIMSADRYIAVCHPISSTRYRTSHIAKMVSAVAWLTSAVLMLPVILYASTVLQEDGVHLSCNIEWPESYRIHSGTTFILYTFFLGFATPLCFILCFYYLVIRKLHAVGAKHKSKEKKRSHRKVTRLVLTVITVYILCWLPHWISQVALINSHPTQSDLSRLEIAIFLLLGCLVYSNSAMNPILYAFLSDNFRKSFFKAFTCMARHEVNAQLQLEPSVFTKQGSRRRGSRRSMCQANKPHHDCKLTAAANNNSSTTTSSTTTAEKAGMGVDKGNCNAAMRPSNGRVCAMEDIILVLQQEHTVCALIERDSNMETILQTDL